MGFYVVGYSARGKGRGVGDALVYAGGSREALTKVRSTGLVPNPGDVYAFGGRTLYEMYPEIVDQITEENLKEALESPDGVSIVWNSVSDR
jgi:hypothetical protein